MEAEKLKPAIEAILFACGTPAELTKIAQALEIKEEKAEELLNHLWRIIPVENQVLK